MKWTGELWEGLLACVEGLYIIEEDSRTIVFVNSFLCGEDGAKRFIGRKCFEAFVGRQTPCPFCPSLQELKETKKPYGWDYFEPVSRQWLNIKNCLVVSDGVYYRIGNVNIIADMVGLVDDTEREIGFMNQLVRERKGMREAMAYEVSHDRLTGLLNRNQYMRDLEDRYEESGPAGVLFFDLNNLKEINDRYHHCEGDRLLCRLADAMKAVEKAVGQAGAAGTAGTAGVEPGRRCYRIGGDEFLLIWEGCSREELEQCRLDILRELERRNENERFPCSVAIGAAWSNPSGKLERLAAEADVQMYEEKKRMKE